MEQRGFGEMPKFKSPEEEIQFLRKKVFEREKEMETLGRTPERRDVISEKIQEYKSFEPSEVLHDKYKMNEREIEKIALNLHPETHDWKMMELLKILENRGIKNAISIVKELKDPHIDDDFHRFLVQYLKKGYSVDGLKGGDDLDKTLKTTLFEVILPEKKDDNERQKSLKELISSMEQFYAGMLSVSPKDNPSENYFSLEIANPNNSEEVIFYTSVPDHIKGLFEKHVLSVFPEAKLVEQSDDYNIFNEVGHSVGSIGVFSGNSILPIKTYDQFDFDPMNSILNSLSKIKKDTEGASIQIIFRPKSDFYLKKFSSSLEKLRKGKSLKESTESSSGVVSDIAKGFKDVLFSSSKKKKEDEKSEQKIIDEVSIENVKNKISSPLGEGNIRVIVSAQDETSANRIISDIESSFNQFENTQGNKIKFERQKGKDLSKLFHNFSFRIFNEEEKNIFNLKELSTLYHFQTSGVKSAPQLKQTKSNSAPAPLGLPISGIILGANKFRGVENIIRMAPEDRLRHFYTIGQTGTGKSTLLKNMIMQDIANGSGVCMIDPHGSDILDILASVPKDRYDDVIYFDPSYAPRPMALNMLEYDKNYPEQKTFVVNEMLSIFNKLFDMKTAGGPMFEQYFRNAVLLVMDDPETGSTLLDVSKVLANKQFRELKISKCKNPIVVQFWKEVAEKAGGEASLANIVPYITSKFDVFLSNDIMRPIIAQEVSSFNFRDVMDNKKILLVNLAKGRLGDINANLIGLVLVGKILMAALSRVDSLGVDLPPFYLYIDEFQNITTDSIATILSEARKYKLGLNIAHQYIAQIDEKIKDAVFGNVGSIVSFRTGSEDAEFLAKQFEPVFTAQDVMNLDNRNAYVKMLVNGRLVKPFNIETLPPPKHSKDHLDPLKELSYLRFGRERREVEEEIMKKYQKPAPASPVTPPSTPKV